MAEPQRTPVNQRFRASPAPASSSLSSSTPYHGQHSSHHPPALPRAPMAAAPTIVLGTTAGDVDSMEFAAVSTPAPLSITGSAIKLARVPSPQPAAPRGVSATAATKRSCGPGATSADRASNPLSQTVAYDAIAMEESNVIIHTRTDTGTPEAGLQADTQAATKGRGGAPAPPATATTGTAAAATRGQRGKGELRTRSRQQRQQQQANSRTPPHYRFVPPPALSEFADPPTMSASATTQRAATASPGRVYRPLSKPRSPPPSAQQQQQQSQAFQYDYHIHPLYPSHRKDEEERRGVPASAVAEAPGITTPAPVAGSRGAAPKQVDTVNATTPASAPPASFDRRRSVIERLAEVSGVSQAAAAAPPTSATAAFRSALHGSRASSGNTNVAPLSALGGLPAKELYLRRPPSFSAEVYRPVAEADTHTVVPIRSGKDGADSTTGAAAGQGPATNAYFQALSTFKMEEHGGSAGAAASDGTAAPTVPAVASAIPAPAISSAPPPPAPPLPTATTAVTTSTTAASPASANAAAGDGPPPLPPGLLARLTASSTASTGMEKSSSTLVHGITGSTGPLSSAATGAPPPPPCVTSTPPPPPPLPGGTGSPVKTAVPPPPPSVSPAPAAQPSLTSVLGVRLPVFSTTVGSPKLPQPLSSAANTITSKSTLPPPPPPLPTGSDPLSANVPTSSSLPKPLSLGGDEHPLPPPLSLGVKTSQVLSVPSPTAIAVTAVPAPPTSGPPPPPPLPPSVAANTATSSPTGASPVPSAIPAPVVTVSSPAKPPPPPQDPELRLIEALYKTSVAMEAAATGEAAGNGYAAGGWEGGGASNVVFPMEGTQPVEWRLLTSAERQQLRERQREAQEEEDDRAHMVPAHDNPALQTAEVQLDYQSVFGPATRPEGNGGEEASNVEGWATTQASVRTPATAIPGWDAPSRVSQSVLLRDPTVILACEHMAKEVAKATSAARGDDGENEDEDGIGGVTKARALSTFLAAVGGGGDNTTVKSAPNAAAGGKKPTTGGNAVSDMAGRQRTSSTLVLPASVLRPVEAPGGPFVELSPSAKLLLSAVLYIRALGGFPTLLRVGPLPDISPIIDKENCLELVFWNPADSRSSPEAEGHNAAGAGDWNAAMMSSDGGSWILGSSPAGQGRALHQAASINTFNVPAISPGASMTRRESSVELQLQRTLSSVFGAGSGRASRASPPPPPSAALGGMSGNTSTTAPLPRSASFSFQQPILPSPAASTPVTRTPQLALDADRGASSFLLSRENSAHAMRSGASSPQAAPNPHAHGGGGCTTTAVTPAHMGSERDIVNAGVPHVPMNRRSSLRRSASSLGREDLEEHRPRDSTATAAPGAGAEAQTPASAAARGGAGKNPGTAVFNASSEMSFNAVAPPQEPPATPTHRGRSRIQEGRDELCVVVRAVVAQKSTVERFGKQEVVHVLPPLPTEEEDIARQLGKDVLLGRLPVGESDPIARLLATGTESATTVDKAAIERRRAQLVERNRRLAARGPRFISEDGTPSAQDYGDLAVAFLLSGSASQLSGRLPDALELEALRYRVFALQGYNTTDPLGINLLSGAGGGDNGGTASPGNVGSISTMPSNLVTPMTPGSTLARRRLTRRRSTFEEALAQMAGYGSAAEAQAAREEYAKREQQARERVARHALRFPLYRASSVSETTLTNYLAHESAKVEHKRTRHSVAPGASLAGASATATSSKNRSMNSVRRTHPDVGDGNPLHERDPNASVSAVDAKNTTLREAEADLLRFRPLRLTGFYGELLDAVQFALNEQVRQTKEKVMQAFHM